MKIKHRIKIHFHFHFHCHFHFHFQLQMNSTSNRRIINENDFLQMKTECLITIPFVVEWINFKVNLKKFRRKSMQLGSSLSLGIRGGGVAGGRALMTRRPFVSFICALQWHSDTHCDFHITHTFSTRLEKHIPVTFWSDPCVRA